MAKYEEVKEKEKSFFKLFITNIGKAIILIAIFAVYAIPLSYIVTSNMGHTLKGSLMFTWVVLWIVMLITYYQYSCKKHGKENY